MTKKNDDEPKIDDNSDDLKDDGNEAGGNDDGSITQEQANKIAGDARDQGRKTGRKSLYEDLGYESEDDLKSALAEKKKLEQDKLSETERLEAQKTDLEKELADEQAKNLKLENDNLLRDKRDELQKEAAKEDHELRLDAVQKVWNLAVAEGLQDEITLDDDGKLQGMESVITKLIEIHPYIIDVPGGTLIPDRSNGGGNLKKKKKRVKPVVRF